MFAARRRLFELAQRGEVSFDDDAYRSVELLINGIIRYTHKYTLIGFIVAVFNDAQAKRDDKDYVDFGQQLALKISRLGSQAETEINSILGEIHNSLLGYLGVTSFAFMVLWVTLRVVHIFKPNRAKQEIDRQVFIMEREAYISARYDLKLATA
jgi:hypothetical protein